MTQIRSLLIGTALTAALGTFATGAALAQTAAPPAPDVAGQAQMQAPVMQAPAAQGGEATPAAPAAAGIEQPVTPAPQRLTASSPTDPLVQKRNADAQANANYSASKKASKTQYKQQVHDAKVNRKADKQAANNEMKADMKATPAQAATPGPDSEQH